MKSIQRLVVIFSVPLLLWFSVFGDDQQPKNDHKVKQSTFRSENYSLNRDIAFVSVWGSRPDEKKLQGFKHAILYNARGEVVQKIDIGRDSVYSLDKMIQENNRAAPVYPYVSPVSSALVYGSLIRKYTVRLIRLYVIVFMENCHHRSRGKTHFLQ